MISANNNLNGKITAKQELSGKLNNKEIEVYPELETLEVTPSTEEQVFKSENYYGFDNVIVAGDNNLSPENIKKDIKIFGVSGNLRPDNKDIFNVFLSEDEPETKQGLWLKTSRTYSDIKASKKAIKLGEVETTIPYQFTGGQSAVRIGEYVYLFGSDIEGNYYQVYKYNLNTKEFTQIPNTTIRFIRGSVTAYGTDIYINGCNYSGSYWMFYKFDTITETFTNLGNTSFPSTLGGTVIIGNYLYAFGGSYDVAVRKQAYKYNIETDTWTKLENLPITFYAGQIAVVGTDIYLFFGNDACKFDTITETYTTLSNVPYSTTDGCAVVVDDKIYLIGSGTEGITNNIYEYDTKTDSYTKLTELFYDFNTGTAIEYNKVFYLFGGRATENVVSKVDIFNPIFQNNTLLILQENNTYSTELFNENAISGLTISFSDVSLYDADEVKLIENIPTSYGDGEQWISFKN